MECANHKSVQHRDNKEPWCKNCGLTEDYRWPETLVPKIETDITDETTIFEDIREAETIEAAIAYTIGAASTCWTEGARGEFMSDHASELATALEDRVKALVRYTIGHAGTFRQDLRRLINVHSMENRSNTPDWILTEYLMKCLEAWESGTAMREEYYGREQK